jgi:hypothetical protein
VIAQVMTQLRFPGSALINLFEGVPKMIESPLIEKWKAEAVHEMILDTLKRRFDSTPREITKPLRRIFKEKKHKHLNWIAFNCDNLDEFAEAVKLVPPDPKV